MGFGYGMVSRVSFQGLYCRVMYYISIIVIDIRGASGGSGGSGGVMTACVGSVVDGMDSNPLRRSKDWDTHFRA